MGSTPASSGSNKLEPSDWEAFPADSEYRTAPHHVEVTVVRRYRCLKCGVEGDTPPEMPCLADTADGTDNDAVHGSS